MSDPSFFLDALFFVFAKMESIKFKFFLEKLPKKNFYQNLKLFESFSRARVSLRTHQKQIQIMSINQDQSTASTADDQIPCLFVAPMVEQSERFANALN